MQYRRAISVLTMQTRYHSANTIASASEPSDALTRMEAYILQLSHDTAKRLQQMDRQQTTLSNTMSNLSRRRSSFLLTGSWLPNTNKKKKNLDTRCQSLQCKNDQLKEDVRYLSKV